MPGNLSGTILEAVNDLVANGKAADSVLLASAIRSATTATADQASTGADALYLVLDVTVVPGVVTLQAVRASAGVSTAARVAGGTAGTRPGDGHDDGGGGGDLSRGPGGGDRGAVGAD
jgi:hypothetical protein